ncbi:MAG: manganese efflux pump MntP family protein, partial [Faecalibacillus sp.]
MSLIELVLIAISLAMDAFTVSMMYGMTIHHFTFIKRFSIAFYFGLFQAIMPLAGYYLGRVFAYYIKAIDHYIAFFFLFII